MTTEQQRPAGDVNDAANDEIPNTTVNGSNSTSIPSNNELTEELTNGLKRPLRLSESDDGSDNIKKFKPTKNNGEDQLENDTGLNESVVKNNIDEHSYVSKEMPDDKSETSISDNHFGVEVNNVGADDLKTVHLSEDKTTCLTNENTSGTKNNANNKCIPIISRVMKSTKTKDNGSQNNGDKRVQNGKLIPKMSSSLNRSKSLSSLDTLVLLDNSDDDIDNAHNTTQLAGSSGIVKESESCNKELENSVSSETKDAESDDDNNNDVDGEEETVNISSNEDDGDDDDFHRITPDNNSDVSNDDNDGDDDIDNADDNNSPVLTDEQMVDVARIAKEVGRQHFPKLLDLFSSKKLTYDQFESFCTQIICSVMTEKFNIGDYRRDLQRLDDREKAWRSKFQFMSRELKELTSVIHLHRAALKDNIYAKPHIVTRTVGLQTHGDGSYARLQKTVQPTVSDPVDITGEDDDVGLNTENVQPSTSNSEMPPLRKMSPLPAVAKQMPVLLPKANVPSALPLNSVINNDSLLATIDLTDGDDTVTAVPSRLSSEKSPIKLIQRPVLNTNVSTGSSMTQINRSVTTKISPKSVTYIEVPKLQTSNAGFIVRTTSTATGSNPLTSVVSNINMTKGARPYIFRDGKLLPVQLSSVGPRQLPMQSSIVPSNIVPSNIVQSGTVPIATRQLPTAQLTGSLQPVPPAIPIAAAAVHPAPLPGIPNQRSLPTWKKLPPAPKVSLTNSTDAQNSKALVLSWNLPLNKMTADISAYQIYAYHETAEVPRSELWKKIGEVNALPLPMACSLTQFMSGEKYYFAVRAVDVYARVGPFSLPQSAYLIY